MKMTKRMRVPKPRRESPEEQTARLLLFLIPANPAGPLAQDQSFGDWLDGVGDLELFSRQERIIVGLASSLAKEQRVDLSMRDMRNLDPPTRRMAVLHVAELMCLNGVDFTQQHYPG